MGIRVSVVGELDLPDDTDKELCKGNEKEIR
jgi:hypothetical protein